MCVGMYSPRISEDLIPFLFRMGQAQNVSMTKVVDDIIRSDLHIRGLLNDEEANRNDGKKRVSRD